MKSIEVALTHYKMEGILLAKKKTNNPSWMDDKKPEKKMCNRIYTEKISNFRTDLFDENKRLIFAEGLPHTGKTLNAIEAGVIQVMKNKYEKLVIIRPVLIPECGLLPGSLEDKMSLYTRQAKEYVNGACLEGWIALCLDKRIEILPADQLQGNHFRNSFVVIDEAQNIHKKQTFKTLSRVGDNAKFVIIGDTSLGQENAKIKHENILQYSVRKFAPYNHPNIAVHSFYDEEDILGDSFTKFLIVSLIPDFVDKGGD